MSYNIRYDSPNDGENSWPLRKNFAINMILYYEIDIIGKQEVTHRQLNDFLDALPQYAYVGVSRDDGKTNGEFSPVFYRKDKFELIDGNTFWLSEDPAAVGLKGWDAAFPRVVTWAILKDIKTGKKFAFFNTHFDHVGQTARVESAKLLVSKMDEIAGNLPVIISGDFNASPDSEPVAIITNKKRSNYLVDTRSIAPVNYGPDWTFHNFGRTIPEERRIIDFIFVNQNVTVESHAIISEKLNDLYLSDHNPILVKVSL